MFTCTKNQLQTSLISWDIAKILQTCYFGYFGHFWPCPPKIKVSTCRQICYLSASKKINSIRPSLEILQICCKLVVLGILDMSGYGQQTPLYQFEENVDVYLHTKNQISPLLYFRNIAKVVLKCYLGYFGYFITTPTANNINLKETLMFIYMQEINLSPTSFLIYYTFKNFAV